MQEIESNRLLSPSPSRSLSLSLSPSLSPSPSVRGNLLQKSKTVTIDCD